MRQFTLALIHFTIFIILATMFITLVNLSAQSGSTFVVIFLAELGVPRKEAVFCAEAFLDRFILDCPRSFSQYGQRLF